MFWVADFETTVYKNQDYTEVWAAAVCSGADSDDGVVFNNIHDFIEYCLKLPDEKPIIYFHNLAFDGQFILYYLYSKSSGYTQQLEALPHLAGERHRDSDWIDYKWKDRKKWNNRAYSFALSEQNKFYFIRIKKGSKTIEFRDSLKLLPMSVKEIGRSFKTKHQKGIIKYEGFRTAYGEITEAEKDYILNDVYVVKEALQLLFSQGMTRITIGSNCMHEWKKAFRDEFGDLANFFPYPDKLWYSKDETIDHFCRSAYKGGWCYLKPEYAGKVIHKAGFTLDVNSLYPSRMHSESGCVYPYGKPEEIWKGNYIPEAAFADDKYFFVRFKCRFQAKPGMLPTVQIKGDTLYDGREWLLTSDLYNKETGEYTKYIFKDGKVQTHLVQLTMTKTDWLLFREHYNVYDLEISGGCYFRAKAGFFDWYLNYWNEIKMSSTAGRRLLAKLMMTNLYGKTASSDDSSFKYICGYKENGALMFSTQEEHEKQVFYIPVGAAITSYCRDFTIRAAQKNYVRFIYADTDSLHMLGDVSEAEGVTLDAKRFNCWKHEATWERAIFVQQKRYIEVIDGRHDVKCAGMKRDCQKVYKTMLDNGDLSIHDFRRGLIVSGNLKAKLIKGGVILESRDYTMR